MLSVAPMKALCSERYEDWNSRFSGLGLKCLELTGDSMMYDYSELQDVHIILTTPVSLSVRPSVCLSQEQQVQWPGSQVSGAHG